MLGMAIVLGISVFLGKNYGRRFRLKKSLSAFFICFMMTLILHPTNGEAYGADWKWFSSDQYDTYFLDANDITMHRNYNNKIDYIDAWVKTTYSGEGAQIELDDWYIPDIKFNDLQNGYGLYRVRVYFSSGTVDVISVNLYCNDGRTLYSNHNKEKIRVAERRFYLPIYTYITSYLAETQDFSFYKSHKSVFGRKSLNKNGQLSKEVIPAWTIWQKNKTIYYSENTYTYAPDNTIMQEMIAYYELNTVLDTITVRAFSTDENNDDTWKYYRLEDISMNNKNVMDIIPGSTGAAIKRSLVQFCDNNYDFVHRFDGEGITLKK